MAELHINVGLQALARGYITLEAFAEGMAALAKQTVSVRELWLERMNEAQLASVLAAIQPSVVADRPKVEDTLLLGLGGGPGTFTPPAGPRIQQVRTQPLGKANERDEREDTRVVKVPDSKPAVGNAPTAPSLSPPMPVPPPGALPHPLRGGDTTPAPLSEDTVGNRYKRGAQLGAGGLGEVHACEDLVLGRTVAVKVAHQNSEVDSYSSKVILIREARIISVLEHPNIIPIYDAGNDPRRGAFYVMRQVTDTSLDDILRRRRDGAGDPHDHAPNRLLRYFLQVCNAVDFAHHRGVIHCDIKPANILLGEYGEVLLVDWGLAQSKNHPLGVRGGTLGYMAPEQMDSRVERLDERADVFALGAILYEILCGRPAFEEAKHSGVTSLGPDPMKLYKPPPEPDTAPLGIEVTPELVESCMRAIAIHRDERLPSVKMLATAVDELIEGGKQRERRRIEADNSTDAGDELAERYHEFAESRPEQLNVYRSLRADVAPWAPVDEKQDVWDAEDIVRVTDALQVRTFHSAVSAYERALDATPNHPRARRGLARLYWSQLERARRRGEALDQIAYEQLLREVDDGTYVRELQKGGTVELAIGPHASRVTLATLVERQRRLVEGSLEVVAERPVVQRALAAGRYVVTASIGDAAATVSWPINVEPGSHTTLAIEPPAASQLRAHEVVIPGGRARLGGDPLATETDELFEIDVPTFILERYPITFAQWFEFLDALRDQGEKLVEPHIPRTALGLPTWRWHSLTTNTRGWTAEITLPVSDAELQSPDKLPVFGISAESAEAFARWRSQKDGVAWRLPTELEWEKAGRGTDARIYPWGDHFDATFCKMRDSRAGVSLAEDIGAFPWDISPYGVCDLAGGVADWCTADPRRTSPREPREVVSRGGAWCDWPIDCRLASRRRYLATEHSARVGVRLARDP